MLLYSDLTTTPTSITSLTYVNFGLSLDVPCNGGLVELDAVVPFVFNNTVNCASWVAIFEDASTAPGGVDTLIEENAFGPQPSSVSCGSGIRVNAILRPSPGKRTYKIKWHSNTGGTTSTSLSATSRAKLKARL